MPRKKVGTAKKTQRSAPYTITQPGGKVASAKPAARGAKGKKGAQASTDKKKDVNPLFEKNARNFGIGQAIQPRRDLTRFVRWPKYIRLQRQKRVLYHRLSVPPAINQFSHTLNKNLAVQLFALLDKYKPESEGQKKDRLRKAAKKIVKDKETPKISVKPSVKYGINQVTSLAEQKQAQVVIIAHDVDPIELVIHLPALCRKLEIPYCIVKGKARLGQVVRKKTATALAITAVNKEHQKELDNIREVCLKHFNSNKEIVKAWGGNQLGRKSLAAAKKKRKD